MSMNKVILLGNVGKTPDVQTTSNGTSVAKFTLATSERYKDRAGNIKDLTEWHTVRCWRATADFVGNYVKKGSQVLVEGKLHTESWEGSDGQKRYQVIIEAENIQLLDRREGVVSTKEHEQMSRPSAQPQPRAQQPDNDLDPKDDDMPF